MRKYILFDLDGTLLPMDTDQFLVQYVRLITSHFVHLVEPKLFSQQLMASSYAIIGNPQAEQTNQEKFIADFFPKIGDQPENLMPLFDQFYQDHFKELREHTNPTPLARELAELSLERGYKIALATNPIFPKEAIWQRMAWAGVDDLPWELVTSYEDTHFCKPNPNYFAELLQRLGARPEECLHFGNDLDEDMAAAKLGIPVVIVEDCLINRHNRSFDQCFYHGSFQDVLDWAKEHI
jgi:FMN phosphatase YigB (HAD superfamily)